MPSRSPRRRPVLPVRRWLMATGAGLAVLAVVAGCAPAERGATEGDMATVSSAAGTVRPPSELPATPSLPVEPSTTATTAPAPSTPTSPLPAPATGVGAFLAPLRIDDAPAPQVRYDRDDWAGWSDTDGDGCDGRNQALIAASISPAQVDRFDCTVVAGDWFSAYDGFATSDPSDLDVDHLVSLSEAHDAGGWEWSASRRRQFANDQANLWVVSASSNRSKSNDGPHQWRPARAEVWCEYAVRWVQVKVAWQLSATTPERDALGAMLDRCPALPPPPQP